jgi:hypothetical protein
LTIAIAALLTVAVFAAAAYPFIRHQRTSLTTVHGNSLKELHFRRDHTYAMLKELESDYKSGTLSEVDYKTLESRYKSHAVSILKELGDLSEDKPMAAAGFEDDIEEQVRSLRHKAPAGKRGSFCPQCGSKNPPDSRFCPDCGTRL